jgi:diguanylate cyclase (GGDEF)-like protein
LGKCLAGEILSTASSWQGATGILIKDRPSDQGQDEAATTDRMQAAELHARDAARRDELACRRDEAAAERDRAAEQRDRRINELASRRNNGFASEEVVVELKRLLASAANDRARAAADRRLAAEERARAAEERSEAIEALESAHFDDLTGAHRRGFGEAMLRAEIVRARRRDGRLVFALVDVDGLKEVNDTEGHFAGDELLREVVAAIRANIRSYEPVVRLGGDEFAFTIAGMDLNGARDRCTVIQADLARRLSGARITFGCTGLRPDDDLDELYRRADCALVEARKRRIRISHQP